MHLWPSTKLRDSFKRDYLKKLEWNLHRMNSEKKQSSENSQKKLLDDADDDQTNKEEDSCGCREGVLLFFRELVMIFSCCYCCGACVDPEEN